MRALHLTLCTDFDGTVSRHDTTPLLLRQAVLARPLPRRAVFQQQIETILARYVANVDACVTTALASTRHHSFDAAALRTCVAACANVEKAAMDEVVEHKVLAGISAQALEQEGFGIAVREGCVAALQCVDRIDVISSNWCDYMLLHALAKMPLADQPVRLLANTLAFDENCLTTGEIVWRVTTGEDKAQCLREHIAQARRHECVVFVGDDWNDILAMVEADVGILLAPATDSTVRRICEGCGVEIHDLETSGGLLKSKEKAAQAKKHGRCVVFAAQDWNAIGAVFKEAC